MLVVRASDSSRYAFAKRQTGNKKIKKQVSVHMHFDTVKEHVHRTIHNIRLKQQATKAG